MDSKYCYQSAVHIATGNIEIITDTKIRYNLCKGPKYRFPSLIG